MNSDPLKHHRRSIRLKGFDYSQTASYFVTLVCHQRAMLFGEVIGDEVRLNNAGKIIESAWLALEDRFPTVALDEFIIMPNHMHAIITIGSSPVGATLVVASSPADTPSPVGATLVVASDSESSRAGTSPAPTITTPSTSLGDVIGAFKSIATHDIILAVRRGDLPPFAGKVWQRNYYEHIIRNEEEWARISQYICENPIRWAEDAENPVSNRAVIDGWDELTEVLSSRVGKSQTIRDGSEK
jgi:REP element-mobilizing transposase RayT